MRKVIVIVLAMVAIIEVFVICFSVNKKYVNIERILDGIKYDTKQGITLHLVDVIVNDREYSELICCIQNEKASIYSLKTEGDELIIPSKLGKYLVENIGGTWDVFPHTVEDAYDNPQSIELGTVAWMKKEEKKLKRIVIEEGIIKINNEAFYGIKTQELRLPKSLKEIGALSFADSEIDNLQIGNNNMEQKWGAFNEKEVTVSDECYLRDVGSENGKNDIERKILKNKRGNAV